MEKMNDKNPGYIRALFVCLTGHDVMGYITGLIEKRREKIQKVLISGKK